MVVTLEEMKNYLRVDFDDDDVLLKGIIEQSQQLCMDVARIEDEDEFEDQPIAKIAVMYAVAYLYEHREEADHKALTLSLRSLLFGVRQEGF
ncbi:MAG: head-tail connector protein [Lachnospiraceae bacterium]|nr:head-tail connector protein [Lachnospiraceae bacterium]